MRVCPRCCSIYSADPGFCGVDGAELVEQDDDPLIGRTIDRYHIRERLGAGGMGCVYRARHAVLEREYAVKVLFGDMASHKTLAERFRREAQAVSRMHHPNIVSIADFGTTDSGLTFLVMELLPGRTLGDELLVRGPLPPLRAAAIAQQMAEGLAEAHRHGFVHRDLKPGNVMLLEERGEERVKILDFGIVGLTQQSSESKLTRTGFVLGTPAYMSPEQAQDSDVGASSDLYALGVIFYEMLAGQLPFTGESSQMVMVKHITEPPPPLPPSSGLELLVYQLLAKRPAERPASAQAIALELAQHVARLRGDRGAATDELAAARPRRNGSDARAVPTVFTRSAGDAPAAPKREPARSDPPPSPSDELAALGEWSPQRTAVRAGATMLALGAGIFGLTLWLTRPRVDEPPQKLGVAPLEAPVKPSADPVPPAVPVEPPQAQEPPPPPAPAEPVPAAVVPEPVVAPPASKRKKPTPVVAKADPSEVSARRVAALEAELQSKLSSRGLSMGDLEASPSTRRAAQRWLAARARGGAEAEAALEALIAEVGALQIGGALVQARLDRLSSALTAAKDKLPAAVLSGFEDRYLELATEVRPNLDEERSRALLRRIDRISGELAAKLRAR